MMNTPAFSGGATLHTVRPHDNLIDVLPSHSTLFLVACQVGNINITHIGAGSITGLHYNLSVPRKTFLSKAQTMINQNSDLAKLYPTTVSGKLSESALFEKSYEWMKATTDLKAGIVKEMSEKLVSELVLGFQVDMNNSDMICNLRPVISETHYKRFEALVSAKNLQVIRPGFNGFLLEYNQGYSEFQSVFGKLPFPDCSDQQQNAA